MASGARKKVCCCFAHRWSANCGLFSWAGQFEYASKVLLASGALAGTLSEQDLFAQAFTDLLTKLKEPVDLAIFTGCVVAPEQQTIVKGMRPDLGFSFGIGGVPSDVVELLNGVEQFACDVLAQHGAMRTIAEAIHCFGLSEDWVLFTGPDEETGYRLECHRSYFASIFGGTVGHEQPDLLDCLL